MCSLQRNRGTIGGDGDIFHLSFGGNYVNIHICLPKFIQLYTEKGEFCSMLITCQQTWL